ncbi:helix-turn-helix domain-containing protein [Undibacterium jejuense]|uniref:Helix-turn-helix domain-containing protein n=1 Tax=Undibacterium jejuense TaxID=1344949 RepID=A0A923HJR7_9BURK|nr:helix-turn-helix transcriptional regulator [Undibacterium jejuense]MBC3860961.1 helix-turn-helix domain-containing protein [Undibacterium jejuense]
MGNLITSTDRPVYSNSAPLATAVPDSLAVTKGQNAHQALGNFLRARRESLDPARLGLPRTGRRRTPGLRREDVAALADIGITWYTKLEQGRSIKVSARALAAITQALQCTDTETAHVFALAGMSSAPSIAEKPGCEKVSPVGQLILDQLHPIPGLMQNARFDILGYNQAFQRLMNVDLAGIPKSDRNCIYLAMTHPVWRASMSDCQDAIPRMVAQFRAAMGEHLHDSLWEKQLQRFMNTSSEFRDAWQRYEVRSVENQVKQFHHPQAGILNLQLTNWWSAPKNGDRLMIYVPVDEESKHRLELLTDLCE